MSGGAPISRAPAPPRAPEDGGAGCEPHSTGFETGTLSAAGDPPPPGALRYAALTFTGWLTRRGRALVWGAPMLWLGLFFLAPFLVVLRVSLAERAIARPPYTDLFGWEDGLLTITLNLGNYLFLWEDFWGGDWYYLDAYLGSIVTAATSTLVCLLVAYPMALFIARARPSRRPLLPGLWRIPSSNGAPPGAAWTAAPPRRWTVRTRTGRWRAC